MVALRKDVKVGFVVGGIALAVVAVYLGLSALTGSNGDQPVAATADQQTSPAEQGSSTPTLATEIPVIKGDAAKPAVAGETPKPADAVPSRLPASPVAKAASSDDVWSNAFASGTVAPRVTQTPPLASRDAAKPSDVIDALNGTPAPAPADAPRQTTASTGDPSGAILNNGGNPTLIRAPESTGGTTTRPAAGGTSYTVLPGDTFSTIAADHYGSANKYRLIVAANPNVDPTKLKPGTVLTLPADEKPAAAIARPDQAIDANTQYVVQSGDSLEAIASKLYGERSRWQSIYDANKSVIGDSPAKLKVGTILALPSAPTQR